MSAKIGRNEPCPCGSGKKYKHCCGAVTAIDELQEKGHAGAVERALAWLASRHRKATGAALQAMIFEGLTDDERGALETQDDEAWEQIQLNAHEWLLAEGTISVGGKPTRVADLLLGVGGPLFTVGQRQWLAQLSERPLRMYDVTDAVLGKQMTLCDALENEAPPIVVSERSGSHESLVGTQIGFRLMEVDEHWELSGAGYSFSPLVTPRVIAALHEAMERAGRERISAAEVSSIIRRQWLAQFFAAAPIPTIVDAVTGDPMLFITDHYRVKDWAALQQALTTRRDVEGDRQAGWNRLVKGKDKQLRPTASINPEGTERVSLFYRAQDYADEGRPWFEALAGEAVQFLTRELSDPVGVMANLPATPKEKSKRREPDLPPEVLAEVIEKAIRQSYANWADEPIPALGGTSPRQAIQTPTGLERVKGLLRSYEAKEKEQARDQGRRPISYDFLWKALGVAR